MSVRDEQVSQIPDQLMEQLLKGYDSLRAELEQLSEQQEKLKRRLDSATQQTVGDPGAHLPTAQRQSTPKDRSDGHPVGEIDWIEQMSKSTEADRRARAFHIRTADDAREKLRNRQQDVAGVRIWTGRPGDRKGSVSSKLRYELERDFTVPGQPSKLGCPFAVPRSGGTGAGVRNLPTPRSSTSQASQRGRRPSGPDPIKMEICGNDPPSPVISEHGSSALCPIRFMDQHSPEEVAHYFEKHKHQIPRSHEVCIKRYQGNEESVKHLDAKYGSLVSMIHGLGQKHQPILAEKEVEPSDGAAEGPQSESVDRWVDNVAAGFETPQQGQEAGERTSRFDRPLKDVRVGESPSRPWGITVPSRFDAVSHDEPGALESSGAAPAAKCPFSNAKLPQPSQGPKVMPPNIAEPAKAALGDRSRQMTFTGPVFIGYPMEQALLLMREHASHSRNSKDDPR